MAEALYKKSIYSNLIENKSVLYMAMELSNKTWKLGFSDGSTLRTRDVAAADIAKLLEEINIAKHKFKLPKDTMVVSCYEAGRDGFWIHNCLTNGGIHNFVIDSASLEQNRKKRKAKTDKIDVRKMVRQLYRFLDGDELALSIVAVPSEEDEDNKRLHRERDRLVKERSGHVVRIDSLLVMQGIKGIKVDKYFLKALKGVRRWNGQGLGQDLWAELAREYERYELVDRQVKQLEQAQKARVRQAKKDILDGKQPSKGLEMVDVLMMLKGVGWQSAWMLVYELFSWRKFRNRKKLAGFVGLTGTPFDSGDSSKEQGISKSGSARLRSLLVELSWFWLRYQPQSELAQWFEQRFGKNGKRSRRVGIVAVARKLLIALWRMLETGELPKGAALKREYQADCMAA